MTTSTAPGDAAPPTHDDLESTSSHTLTDLERAEKHGVVDNRPQLEKNQSPPDEEAPPPAPAKPAHDPSSFPDGGRDAWLVVLGAFCSLFVSFGWINCIGVFQDYYQQHQLSRYSPSDIAWIPSLETFVMFFGGPIVGFLYDNHGPHLLLLVGSFLHVFGLMMASISKEYYQFILSQGVCSPMGAAMVFYPSVSAVSTWFFRRRALANGIVASGSSLGGVIMPIMVTKLVPEVGFGWSVRITAFMILALLIIANLTIKARLPPTPREFKLMNFITPLGEMPFALTTFACFIFVFGIFQPFTFLISQARRDGMSSDLAGYMIPLLNAASVFGRILPGYAADKWGRFNMMILMCILCAIIVLALWLPGHGNAAIIVFALIYGFGSGAFVSLAPPLIAQISDVRQIGVRVGAAFGVMSLSALTGTPIGGQLVIIDNGGYSKLQIFTGVMLAGGTVFFVLARVRLAGFKLLAKV